MILNKYLLATSDYGNELQQDLNVIVGHNEKFNNAIVKHALDSKNDGIMQNPNPLNLIFWDIKKIDIKNSVIGKLVSQVKASKLTNEQLTKHILAQDEIANIENRLEELKKTINIDAKDDDEHDHNNGSGGNVFNRKSRIPDHSAPPPSPPPPPDEMTQRFNEIRYGAIPSTNELMQRLNQLRYNTGTANIRTAPQIPSFQPV